MGGDFDERAALRSLFGLPTLLILSAAAFDLVCTILICMRISIWAKTVGQAIGVGIAVTFVLIACMSLPLLGLLAEPIVAAICYMELVKDFRQYAAR